MGKINKYCREQFARGGYDGCLGGHRDEVVELGLAVDVAARDAYHIVRIFATHFSVFVNQSHTHALSMIFVGTEYDSLGHGVSAAKIVADFMGHLTDSIFGRGTIC